MLNPKSKIPFFLLLFTLNFTLFPAKAHANNLTISNVSLETRNAAANTVVVEFDISWDHSWRMSNGEHDAAWVFVKLLDGNTGTPTYPWLHGKLYTAGTNPNDGTSPGTNTNLEVVVPSDKIGAFIRRKVSGTGTVSSQNVRLVVDYGTAGAADGDTITAKVYGIEMVYIPEGPFYAGGDNPDLNEVVGNASVSAIYSGTDPFFSIFDSIGTFQLSRRLGSINSEEARAVGISNSNYIAISGYVQGNSDLSGDGDSTDSNESTGGVNGNQDVFISVFSSLGTSQWAERLGGTGNDIGYGTALLSNNSAVVIGQVTGNGDLSGDADTGDSNESTGGVYNAADGFVSVFDSSGTFQWAERIGGTSTDVAYGVAVDSNNSVIVAGQTAVNTDLNGDADTADTNETGGGVYGTSLDAFITVFSSTGTFQWSERLGGTATDYAYAVAAAVDRIVVSGYVSNNADLNGDADTADTNETGNTGVYAGSDVYVAVFNSSGTFQWGERLGGTTSNDVSYGVATDQSGNVVVTGYVQGNADLNGDGDTSDTNESAAGVYGGFDVFISKFNSAGTFQWSERLGGSGNEIGYAVAISNAGSVAVTGSLITNGNVDINGDGDTDDENEATGGIYSPADVFVSVFDSAGTFEWSKRLGGTSGDVGYGIRFDSYDSLIVAGSADEADLNSDATITTFRSFYQAGVEDQAVQISTTGKVITVDKNSSDDIDSTSITVTGGSGITSNTSWPEGYEAFYLMKYELTQQQYRDFLNTLSRTQQSTRVASTITADTVANYYVMTGGTSVSYRQGIRAPASSNGTANPITFGCDFNSNGTFNEADDGCDIAMNWVNWPDVMAYADWAGLRPVTELEFEKALRGPNSATYPEYAWGSEDLTQATSISNSGRSNETAGNAGAGLAVYNSASSVQGPLKAGFAATNATNRRGAGAGYYGNMDMSGNVIERAVTLGNSTGRAFTGTQGDGVLTTTSSYEGNATNNDWPGIDATSARGVTAGTGGGWRGGGWSSSASVLYVADRNTATGGSITRASTDGGRLGRTAP